MNQYATSWYAPGLDIDLVLIQVLENLLTTSYDVVASHEHSHNCAVY